MIKVNWNMSNLCLVKNMVLNDLCIKIYENFVKTG